MGSAIRTEDLSLRFGSRTVLDKVDFTVDQGEMVAVVGSSGSGKSSLLLCLSGLRTPDSGTIEIGGRTLTGLRRQQADRLRRELIGFVFQSGDLVPGLTVSENVALPLRLAGVAPKPAILRAGEQLEILGIGGLADREIHDISGGELQRAAIARALVHGPEVVLADEPTGALDDDNADVVFELLRSTASAAGAAVVLVTHNNALAARADRRYHVENAKLVER